MKTKEEWNRELDPRMGIEERENDVERTYRIQLDAFRAGMMYAAAIAHQKNSGDSDAAALAYDAIVETATNLKELPEV